jgi:DNA-binding transcriptional LysR family regulator
MQNGIDDLYIIGQSYTEAELETVPFLENPIVFFASPDHPLAEQNDIPVAEVVKENIFGRELGSETSLILAALLEAQGLPLKSTMRLGSNEAIKLAVKSRLGISMLSQLALTREVENGELVILDVEGFPRMDSWHIAYLKGGHLSAVAEAFFNFLINNREAYTREFLNLRRRKHYSEGDRRNKRTTKSR